MSNLEKQKRSKLLGTDIIFMNLPYLLFLAFLGVIYISNTYAAERKLRDVQLLSKQIKEAKSECIHIQQQIMHGTTQTQLSKKTVSGDLKENRSIPEKIIVNRS